ncbi:hypothetical protein CC79DRAFT_1320643 [Sarocladium strictum]
MADVVKTSEETAEEISLAVGLGTVETGVLTIGCVMVLFKVDCKELDDSTGPLDGVTDPENVTEELTRADDDDVTITGVDISEIELEAVAFKDEADGSRLVIVVSPVIGNVVVQIDTETSSEIVVEKCSVVVQIVLDELSVGLIGRVVVPRDTEKSVGEVSVSKAVDEGSSVSIGRDVVQIETETSPVISEVVLFPEPAFDADELTVLFVTGAEPVDGVFVTVVSTVSNVVLGALVVWIVVFAITVEFERLIEDTSELEIPDETIVEIGVVSGTTVAFAQVLEALEVKFP